MNKGSDSAGYWPEKYISTDTNGKKVVCRLVNGDKLPKTTLTLDKPVVKATKVRKSVFYGAQKQKVIDKEYEEMKQEMGYDGNRSIHRLIKDKAADMDHRPDLEFIEDIEATLRPSEKHLTEMQRWAVKARQIRGEGLHPNF